MARGLEQGLEQGLTQGLQHERSLVLRQLTHRLGNLSPDLQAQIQTLSATQLEDLGVALLDFSDSSDLATWLQAAKR